MTDPPTPRRATWAGHLRIARVDHWFKNVFVIPGTVVAFAVEPQTLAVRPFVPVAMALLAVCLAASSNYTLNEVVDAESDRAHPVKHRRPVPAGEVGIGLAYLQWLTLAAASVLVALGVSTALAATVGALLVMGVLYNVRPIRAKDIAYVDVLSESINNPLRFLIGWFAVSPASPPPASLLLSYWMVGCYFMALKRFAEYRAIGNPERAAEYRRSFVHYDDQRLLVSVMFYAAAAMLLFGAFIMRYRLELLLAFPLVAWVMSSYLALGLAQDSPVQRPEKLYRQPKLMTAVLLCTVALVALLAVDLPWIYELLAPRGGAPW